MIILKSLARKILESIPHFDLYTSSLKKDSHTSLKQMIRDGITSELEAISLYEVQIASVDDPVIKRTLSSIRDEEIAHIGELYSLLKRIQPDTESKILSGEDEVREMIEKSGLNIPMEKI